MSAEPQSPRRRPSQRGLPTLWAFLDSFMFWLGRAVELPFFLGAFFGFPIYTGIVKDESIILWEGLVHEFPEYWISFLCVWILTLPWADGVARWSGPVIVVFGVLVIISLS
jgi:hypothetical protein